MATFITNIKFSQQGIKDIDHTTKRAAIFKAEAKKLGAKVKDIYWTLGDHDGLLILEAPDDELCRSAKVTHTCSAKWNHYLEEEDQLTPSVRLRRLFLSFGNPRAQFGTLTSTRTEACCHLGGVASTVIHLTLFMRMNAHRLQLLLSKQWLSLCERGWINLCERYSIQEVPRGLWGYRVKKTNPWSRCPCGPT